MMKKKTSIWQESIQRRTYPALSHTIKREAVVIGGGMAGILTAYFLQSKGIETVVLEADRIGSGQTEHTTAKITSQHGAVYRSLITQFGKEGAGEYARRSQQAIEDYARVIQRENIECEFRRVPAYLYTRRQQDLLKQEEAAARSLGIKCEFQRKSELPFPVNGVLAFYEQAQFHPLKFLMEISRSLEIYEKTPVLKVEGNKAVTPRGGVLAGNIVFASHYPFINRPGYYFMRMHQERSYAVALKNAQELNGMYYGIDPELSWSMRCAGNRLILGGGAHRTGFIPRQDPGEALIRKAKEFWPECEAEMCWSAQDCMTADGIPYIGPFSRKTPQWYVATGFNKWGMTNCMVGARLLTEEILGVEKAENSLFRPQRFKLSLGLPFLLKDGMISMKNLFAAWAGAAPRCPHLGCRLEWNVFEKTWECQCHGSRFREDGKLLDNPAQRGVAKRGESR